MENKEQDDTKGKTTTEHPKPSDEVQLTIETVTPDTVRTVPETAVDSKEVEDKTEDANSNSEVPKADDAIDEQSAKAESQGEEIKAEQETESVEESAEESAEKKVDEHDDDEAVEEEVNESENVERVEDKNSDEGEGNTGAAESSDNDNKEGDDERDKIETIAP